MHPCYKVFCRTWQLAFRVALPVLPYREPKLLADEPAVAALLAERGVRAVLLVTDAPVRRLGLTQPMEAALTARGIAYTVFDEVVQNPTIDNVEAGRARYLESGAQALIAIGGGSAMDCAKVIGARIARPNKPVTRMRGLLHVMRRTPLTVAVPTTAGTGSETTLAAVITDAQARHKYPINDFALIPDYALLDPALTVGLPPHLTGTTGLDALTHAVEAYIGGSTTRLTRQMAEEAVCLIRTHLLQAYQHGDDLDARRGMLRAAYCAGIAFTRSYVGYVHGVAHALGGQYGVPHGLANAVLLPVFLQAYGAACHKRLARLARAAGVVPPTVTDDAQAAEAFLDWVRELNAAMDIPKQIAALREEDLPIIAQHAARESNPLYPVPVLMDAQALADVCRRVLPQEGAVCHD